MDKELTAEQQQTWDALTSGVCTFRFTSNCILSEPQMVIIHVVEEWCDDNMGYSRTVTYTEFTVKAHEDLQKHAKIVKLLIPPIDKDHHVTVTFESLNYTHYTLDFETTFNANGVYDVPLQEDINY